MKTAIAACLLAALGACHATDDGSIDVPRRAAQNVPAEFRAAFAADGSLELLSLFPYPRGYDAALWTERGYDKRPTVGQYVVLGATTLADDRRRRALNAFYKGIGDSDGTVAACFNPRHALRAEHDGHEYVAIICFECLSITFERDGKHAGSTETTKAPGALLTQFLRADGVTLPDQ